MDYKKLYYNLCKYCKETKLTDRIKNRDEKDDRLTSDYIYTEMHHIIPKHSNGSDEESNLVRMLPEEHFMAHLIRYKAYDNANDFYSVRFTLNGFNGKRHIQDIPIKTQNKMVRWFKQHTNEFRKRHNWQTVEGRKRISEAREGKMPVRDKYTGKMIGSVSTDHPKVLSGEWIHHTKGKVSVIEKRNGRKKYITVQEREKNQHLYSANNGDAKGTANTNFSGFSDEELVDCLIELSTKINEGVLVSWRRVQDYYKEKENITLPHIHKNFRFKGKGLKGMYKMAEERTGLKIEKYPRGTLNKNIKSKLISLKEENK